MSKKNLPPGWKYDGLAGNPRKLLKRGDHSNFAEAYKNAHDNKTFCCRMELPWNLQGVERIQFYFKRLKDAMAWGDTQLKAARKELRKCMKKLECWMWQRALTRLWLRQRGRKEFIKTWVHALWDQEWRCSK